MELYAACHRNDALFVAQTNDKLERSFKSPRPGPHVFAAALLLLATGQAPTIRSRSTILAIISAAKQFAQVGADQRGASLRVTALPWPAYALSDGAGPTAYRGHGGPRSGLRSPAHLVWAESNRFRMFDTFWRPCEPSATVGHFCRLNSSATPVNVVIPRARMASIPARMRHRATRPSAPSRACR
jgi:hypothetical protein